MSEKNSFIVPKANTPARQVAAILVEFKTKLLNPPSNYDMAKPDKIVAKAKILDFLNEKSLSFSLLYPKDSQYFESYSSILISLLLFNSSYFLYISYKNFDIKSPSSSIIKRGLSLLINFTFGL